jgi:DNA polymerase-4
VTSAARLILHLDMDAFYASVEQRDNPALRGKPVIVGGGVRGVVTTASYEARPFGVRSAMPMTQALRLCPQAIVIKPRMHVYSEESRAIRAIMDRYTPDVEPLSIDEAFLDCTGTQHLHATAAESDDALRIGAHIGRELKAAIARERSLIASVGVSVNKLLAKIASDLDKPDGLRTIRPEDAADLLAPMPVSVLRGIGAAAAAKLDRLSIRTCADLRTAPLAQVRAALGQQAELIVEQSWGRDARAVASGRAAKSIGQSRTFDQDIASLDALRAVLLAQVEHVAEQLRAEGGAASPGMLARKVTVTFRRPDFSTHTRSTTLDTPTATTTTLWAAARAILEAWHAGAGGPPAGPGPLRLLGVTLHDLEPPGQLSLFSAPVDAKQARLDAAIDAINAKFATRDGAASRPTPTVTRAGAKALRRGDGQDPLPRDRR